ncbi:MAG: ammonium transporter [Planctomycetes bacterium]|nr:ammonium transporter [Planctomycetota bacterium]
MADERAGLPAAQPASQPEAQPASASAINSGDTAWLLTSTALVFIMTAPGLALFYGGLVRRKNVLSVLMQCMMIMCLVSLQWVALGYALSFGADAGGKGVIGTLEWAFLKGVGQEAGPYSATVPHLAFMIFQAMFAVITPALIIGAFAERIRFLPFCVFTLLWATLVYDPVAHWVWSTGGWLSILNPNAGAAMDFAGGTVVHINAGMAALACALFLGKRKGYPSKMSPPHNLPFAVIGAGMLWFGWFGFNAGSALAANGLAANAFVVTHVATATAGLTWAIMDRIFNGKPTVLGVITGAVAGLVAITPASGFVDVTGSICIGAGAGVIPWLFVGIIKPRLGYDDSLDAFGVHGIGGIWGALATGLFATPAVQKDFKGLFFGNPAQFVMQVKAVAVTIVWAFVLTYVLLVLVNAVFKLRAGEHEELVGLDLTQHKETAYTVID